MVHESEITALLKDLGLTETESEVYLALLQTSRDEPVSSYKVAQDMGRDPANLSKILSTLARRGAVRVVQEKPRLFAAVAPDEFTGQILERMAVAQRRTVELLRRYESTPAAGTALALATPDQVLERARLLLGGCRRTAALYADETVCARLRPFIESLDERGDVRLRVLAPGGVELPGAIRLDAPELANGDAPWLQLVVDGEFWLLARQRDDGTLQAPSGWWGEDPGLAAVMGAVLGAAGGAAHAPPFEPAVASQPIAEPEPGPSSAEIEEPGFEPGPDPEPVFEAEPLTEPEPEPIADPEPAAAPDPLPEAAAAAEPIPDEDEDDGFEFVHRQD